MSLSPRRLARPFEKVEMTYTLEQVEALYQEYYEAAISYGASADTAEVLARNMTASARHSLSVRPSNDNEPPPETP